MEFKNTPATCSAMEPVDILSYKTEILEVMFHIHEGQVSGIGFAAMNKASPPFIEFPRSLCIPGRARFTGQGARLFIFPH